MLRLDSRGGDGMAIDGNCSLILLGKTVVTDAMGIQSAQWDKPLYTLRGFLDYQSGEANSQSTYMKVENSTHIFLSDYVDIEANAEDVRASINNELYDVKMIDNPMGLGKHLEIYLAYVGQQDSEGED